MNDYNLSLNNNNSNVIKYQKMICEKVKKQLPVRKTLLPASPPMLQILFFSGFRRIVDRRDSHKVDPSQKLLGLPL